MDHMEITLTESAEDCLILNQFSAEWAFLHGCPLSNSDEPKSTSSFDDCRRRQSESQLMSDAI